jgi:hypothetical protein
MSKATTNLSALMSIGGQVEQAEDAGAALDRLEPDPADQVIPEADDDGQAKFGTPEAIATAVVAGFILGPVGGLLVGGAQGLLKRRADQSILDRMADEQNAITDAVAVYDDQLAVFRESATNQGDLEQIGAMEADRTAALAMLKSGSPDLQSIGMQGFQKFQENLQAYGQRQETQQIAADALDAQLRVELDEREYSRYTGLQSSFDAQSQPYLDRAQAGETALAALQNGSPADLHAAMILFNKTLDPNSAVLGEERTAITDMGGWLDSAYNFVQGAANGKQLNATQRRDLGETILRIMDTSSQFQLQREAGFSDEVNDANLPVKYHDNFRLVSNVPAGEPFDVPQDLLEKTLEADQAARDKQSMLLGDAADAVGTGLDNASMAIGDFADSAVEAKERFMQGLAEDWDTTKRVVGEINENLKGGRDVTRPTN